MAAAAIRARAWTDRHGGPVVVGLLAGAFLLALGLRVAAAVSGLEVRHGSDTDIYERLAARLHDDGAYGLPGSENPYDFAPGPPLLAAAVYAVTGVSPLAARLAMALAGA